MNVPLFPLGTVLYPGGPLPLRIFEARYLDMLGECLKSDQPFGVLLIRSGSETGPATTCDIGTLARVVDWYQGSDGVLGVTAIGEHRFRLISSWQRSDGLNIGDIERLEPGPFVPLPDEYRSLARILADVLDDLGKHYQYLQRHYDDAGWVAYRFAEILPIAASEKQACLELDDPLERLEMVSSFLDSTRDPYRQNRD
ncbi:MAG TPA: LON peptidase substrate-binding domain-containing protein [Woeseiaceae bacterium]